ncbi:LysR family transcriptional regulator [Escherichia coli]|uniref:LysR family transcriptional regulator n=1 Tax=Escherichia coli TaxID=562 RepID=A0A377KB82_ECOLX|nr:LysR family transcriptional regulator [Escherichia coli]
MNSIFTEENLLAFTTAARFGSFSKAAEELGLTTSAISYTIKTYGDGAGCGAVHSQYPQH